MEIVGILNATPDSFSDGGRWPTSDAAIARARDLVAQGASIIDVGGESTRPGAVPLSPADEWARIETIVETLVSDGITMSVDTYHAETARRAIAAGAAIINDVTGGRIEPDILSVVADSDAHYVLQHSRGGAASTDAAAVYGDIIVDVAGEIAEALQRAESAGIPRSRIIVDPGLGFSKIGDQNWEILRRLDELTAALPGRWLIGHSRKRFLTDAGEDRDASTAVISALLRGRVWGVRVHDVQSTARALAIAGRIHD